MTYVLIIILSLFISTGLAFWIVNRTLYRTNQFGEEKPKLESFGTNKFVMIYLGEKSKRF